MKSLSHSEENYLKEIFHLSGLTEKRVSTNGLAARLNTKASSITDMLQKLSEKKLVEYVKYKGCFLTEEGERIAIQIIRKHRLWETFLVNKLSFGWEEVHDVAEQLEHIDSTKLIDSLDRFLNYPKFDPHGDPIPDKDGNIVYRKSKIKLIDAAINSRVEIVRVNEDSLALLKFLERHHLTLGTEIDVLEKFPFDDSMSIRIGDQPETNLSKKVTENIGVKFISKL
ncbi:MAG: metal-dependent transcriptional regulator [Crocinitomix sp.]|nr:metal-dependent transcriptional regulator [Crocinitomix sp.]